jgi:hypothetical protein
MQMGKGDTVWAIVYAEVNDVIPADIEDWALGSAMFSSREKAQKYAQALNEVDAFYVHSFIELEVF